MAAKRCCPGSFRGRLDSTARAGLRYPMRYEGKVYRPPSEADAYILQATIGCSWNRCTYCDMYRDKPYRERDLPEVLEDLRTAVAIGGGRIDKVFVADGDALFLTWDFTFRTRGAGAAAAGRGAEQQHQDDGADASSVGERGVVHGPSVRRPAVGRVRSRYARREGTNA